MAQKMLTNYTEVKSKSGHESLNTRDAAMIALCAAVMAVCSWISIPAAVPFTMQTFGVFLAVGLLGGRNRAPVRRYRRLHYRVHFLGPSDVAG